MSNSTTHAKTLEKSVDGDMTKLSLLLDQDIRFCILESSSILMQMLAMKPHHSHDAGLLVEFVDEGSLDHFGLLRGSCCRCT